MEIDRSSAAAIKAQEIAFWEESFSSRIKQDLLPEIHDFWEKRYYDKLERVLFREIPTLCKGDAEILEAGCGTGAAALRLATGNRRVTLLDASEGALRYARRLAKESKVAAKCTIGDLFDLPFAKDGFDLAFNIGTLEEYDPPDSLRMMEELKRVTLPGGYVLVGIPNPRNPEIYFSRRTKKWQGLERDYREADLRAMMACAGLVDVRISYVPTLFAFGYFPRLKRPLSSFPGVSAFLERLLRRFSVIILAVGRVPG
ncbi:MULTISPECIES: class I SAM-dependent methyltransferase [Streptomyces]|uniref:class I SAM-dependent methyltransferase n=1 Tax=Streptomyces TaxID=1883 RepID=UPI00099B2D52|nr:class I SAM-dependent methyltransferase [Streptomyces virginiae]